MQQFVFVSEQGSFPVPAGESRIGSDAACQICIHGEGILPIHAYLQTDGEKLLLRPADQSTSASGYRGATIFLNGRALTGPANVRAGQQVVIGGAKFRLDENGSPIMRRMWRNTWIRRSLYGVAAIAFVAAVGLAVLYWVILDENALKERIQRAIAMHLLRDDTEIGTIQYDRWNGTVAIRDLRIHERSEFSTLNNDFVTVPLITAKFKLWPLILSWFREFDGLRIVVNKPEINIERSQNKIFNVDDIKRSLMGSLAPDDL